MRADLMRRYWPSKAFESEPEDELAARVRGALAGTPQEWRWRRSDVWICVTPAGTELPPQGWKLHVSATSRSARDVLGSVAPTLIGEGVPFKFAANRERVAALNASDTPRQAAGKFITVYPLDDAQAVRLAHACDRATAVLAGPAILSDRPLRRGSLVHYRYGAFAGSGIFNNDGEFVDVIHDPEGRPVPDERRAWFTPPVWAADPFAPAPPDPQEGHGDGAAARPPRAGVPVLLNNRYVVRHALKHANKGGVYLAEDRATGATVVIKPARPHVEASALPGGAADAAGVLRHEARVLDLVAGLGFTPRLLDLFEQQGHLFLALEHLDGDVLRDHVARRVEDTGCGLGTGELLATVRRLAAMMEALHGAGVLLRDFTPNNVMVLPGELRLIDLELAHPLADGPAPRTGAGTPGFSSPEQMEGRPSGLPDDYYALGATVAYAATGAAPDLIPDTGEDRPAGERLREWIAGAELDGLVTARVCDLVLGCMAGDPARRWGPRDVLAAVEQRRSGCCAHEPATVSRTELAEAVDHINRWLARTVDPGGRYLWPTTGYGLRSDPCNVQYGAGGVGLYLCEAARMAARAEGRAAALDLVRIAAQW